MLYTMFLPYTSDSGPTNNGPKPKPSTKRLIERKVTTCETPNSWAIASSVNAA